MGVTAGGERLPSQRTSDLGVNTQKVGLAEAHARLETVNHDVTASPGARHHPLCRNKAVLSYSHSTKTDPRESIFLGNKTIPKQRQSHGFVQMPSELQARIKVVSASEQVTPSLVCFLFINPFKESFPQLHWEESEGPNRSPAFRLAIRPTFLTLAHNPQVGPDREDWGGLEAWPVLQQGSGRGVQRCSPEGHPVGLFKILCGAQYPFNKLWFRVNQPKLVFEPSNYGARLPECENSDLLCGDENGTHPPEICVSQRPSCEFVLSPLPNLVHRLDDLD